MGKEMDYEILRRFGAISAYPNGSAREVALISWRGGPPKLDIRKFLGDEPERIRPSCTYTRKEAELLRNILNNLDLEDIPE
jgi:hypothetical protein